MNKIFRFSSNKMKMKKALFIFFFSYSITKSFCYSFEVVNPATDSIGNNLVEISPIPRDLVPNEETARKVAEAIWIPLYGEENILEQKPYVVMLVDDIWIVRGLMPEPCRSDPDCRGGTAYIEIHKKNCKVLKIGHER